MQDQGVASHRLRAGKLLRQKIHGEGVGFGFDGIAQIDDIGGVDDKGADAVLLHQRMSLWDAELFDRFAPRILGSPGVEHKRVCAVGQSLADRACHHLPAAHAYMGTDKNGICIHKISPCVDICYHNTAGQGCEAAVAGRDASARKNREALGGGHLNYQNIL